MQFKYLFVLYNCGWGFYINNKKKKKKNSLYSIYFKVIKNIKYISFCSAEDYFPCRNSDSRVQQM